MEPKMGSKSLQVNKVKLSPKRCCCQRWMKVCCAWRGLHDYALHLTRPDLRPSPLMVLCLG